MTKKKLFACLTALCCTASMAAVPVSAEDALSTRQMIVIGVDDAENPQNYIIYNPEESITCYLTADMVDNFLFEGEAAPAYGDVLQITGNILCTELSGTNHMEFLDENYEPTTESNGTRGIANLGTMLDSVETQEYTVSIGGYVDTISLPYAVDEETGGIYAYYYHRDSFVHYNYLQPGGIDWSTVKDGDKVTFLTYEGRPALPTSVTHLGDVNADGKVSIVDVIMLNHHIMGAGAVAYSASSADRTAADFNGDGSLTADDSLSILKRLVGLA